VKLIVSIDVEEDSLFSGQYPTIPPGVTNVRQLERLAFLAKEHGVPLTLLVTHPVAEDPTCCALLKRLAQTERAEIGAHLHPWCTPPFGRNSMPEPVPMSSMPVDALRAKLENLHSSISKNIGIEPVSFRAGRFDLSPHLLQLLPEFGITADSSVVPCHPATSGPPDYPLVFPDPHSHPMEPRVLEVPLTITALWPAAARLVFSHARSLPPLFRKMCYSATRYLNSAGIHPAWFSLAVMKKATRLHAERGGQALNMFLHSSELSPGATPINRTERDVQDFVGKIRRYLEWVMVSFPIEGATLSGLVPLQRKCGHCDTRQQP
jgi:hypothetical protein